MGMSKVAAVGQVGTKFLAGGGSTAIMGATGGIATGATLATAAIAMAAIAAAVATLGPGIYAITTDFEGVGTTIKNAMDLILAHFYTLRNVTLPVIGPLGKLFSKEGKVGKFFLLLLPRGILLLLKAVETFITIEQTLIRFTKKTIASIMNFGSQLWEEVKNLISMLAPYFSAAWDWIAKKATAAWHWIYTAFKKHVIDPIIKGFVYVWKIWHEHVLDPIIKGLKHIWKIWSEHVIDPILEGFATLYNIYKEYFLDPVITVLHNIGAFIQKIIDKIAPFLGWGKAAKASAGIDITKKFADLGTWITKNTVGAWKQSWKEVKSETSAALLVMKAERARELKLAALAARKKKVGEEREQPPQNVFNNARFDVVQKFAEGFDPDRVAVAFSNDLASVCERKLHSMFAIPGM
jgi:hypothetical protein